jgi:hypothetical protein
MKKPRAGSPECGAIVASLPLSRTNRAILQQRFGFELTVPACLDSNQASATDPRPPNSSRSVAGMSVNAYTLMGRRRYVQYFYAPEEVSPTYGTAESTRPGTIDSTPLRTMREYFKPWYSALQWRCLTKPVGSQVLTAESYRLAIVLVAPTVAMASLAIAIISAKQKASTVGTDRTPEARFFARRAGRENQHT